MTEIGIRQCANSDTHPAPPGHPEAASKLAPLLAWLKTQPHPWLHFRPSQEHGEEPVARVHGDDYVQRLKRTLTTSGYFDADTYYSERSWDAVCTAVDAALSAVDDVESGTGPSVQFVVARPPGHHCEQHRPMGFCLVNTIAIATQYARDSYDRYRRVAILDFDVHHGNGTQQIFFPRDDVLFVSTHQYPYYPGTGSRVETGVGTGVGFTLNLPHPAHTPADLVLETFTVETGEALKLFAPDLIMVSVGFDGHVDDPLAQWLLTDDSFRRLGSVIRQWSEEYCGGRLVNLLEGGYSPDANRSAAAAYLEGLHNG